jgi:uncharacterized protein (TIGR02266 family)
MATGSSDKRREPRVPLDLWVEAQREGETYYQRALNLSVGGVYFAQTVPMPLGTRVTLTLTLPGEPNEFTCQGEVVAAKDLGMGVQFVALPLAQKKRVEAAIERIETKLELRKPKA